MNGKDIELSRRRVLGGVATIGAASAAAGAGTFAVWSDTAESTGNTIEAGTLDLEGASDGRITAESIVPGDSIPGDGSSVTIQATHADSSDIDSVTVSFDVSVEPIEEGGDASEFANQLDLDTATLHHPGGEDDLLTQTNTLDTLGDLVDYDGTDATSNVNQTETVGLELAFTFNQDAGNDLQNKGIEIVVSFTAEQET